MTQDGQVRKLWGLLARRVSPRVAALKTGMDEKTARKDSAVQRFAIVWVDWEAAVHRWARGLPVRRLFEVARPDQLSLFLVPKLRLGILRGWRIGDETG